MFYIIGPHWAAATNDRLWRAPWKGGGSSGCESHPATAPAGSNRSSHGGNEGAASATHGMRLETHSRNLHCGGTPA